MNELECVLECRRLLENVTPLKGDCGRLCGRACCRPDENGKGGMLLFPGEEALYAGPDGAGFTMIRDDSVTENGLLLVCSSACRRETRPLGCRFFPLRPTSKGRAVMDRRSAWVCPLYENGVGALDGEFVAAAGKAAALLCGSESLAEFVRAVGRKIREDREAGLFGDGGGV